jgi:hypothetical protein
MVEQVQIRLADGVVKSGNEMANPLATTFQAAPARRQPLLNFHGVVVWRLWC